MCLGFCMKKWCFVLYLYLGFCFVLLTAVLPAQASEKEAVTIKESELFSQAAVLMDAASGRVLYGKNEDLVLAMASTTKIMTCITALEYGNEEDIVTASGYAAAQPKVKLYLSKGEQVFLGDLLYSLMLESHNDTAVAIAEHIGAGLLGMENAPEDVIKRTDAESKKAVAAFIGLMNDKARALQCYDTWFITPNGLDAAESFSSEEGIVEERFHATTAKELARIMSYCILQSPKKEDFLRITSTYSYDFTNVEKTRSFICRNHNAFLNMMEGAVSGKTGYTGRAGYCYVGALVRDGRYFVVASLNSGAYGGANKTRKWQDTKRLMNYAIEYFTYQVVYEGDYTPEPVTVEQAQPFLDSFFEERTADAVVAGNKEVTLLKADWEAAEVKTEQRTVLEAPVRAGQIIGSVEVTLNGQTAEHFDIICTEDVERVTFWDYLRYVFCSILSGKNIKKLAFFRGGV